VTKEEIIKRNLDLHAEWMKYAFEHPDVLDRIPKGAVLVILPEDDDELYAENSKILEDNKKKNIPVFVVTMKMPKPQISKIEVIAV
jgi:siroheme synthase (precorrin-2 oxidase/ferrochelatase)